MSAMGRREVYRRRWLLVFNLAVFGVLELVLVMGLISTARAAFWPGVAVFSLLLLAVTTSVAALARVAVVATATGILVRGFVRTTRVAWTEIDRILLPGEESERQITIVLRSGDRLRPTAFEGGRGWSPPKAADAFARRLQHRLPLMR